MNVFYCHPKPAGGSVGHHWGHFGAGFVISFMSEKVGLTIYILCNKYVLHFPQKPNTTCKTPKPHGKVNVNMNVTDSEVSVTMTKIVSHINSVEFVGRQPRPLLWR